jgi:diaminopimelate decarboxylase
MIKLTPVIDPTVLQFIAQKQVIYSLINSFGSPLNVIFPGRLSDNVKKFKYVFQKYNLDGKIYYAHKANKSKSLVKQAEHEKIFIDVSSENELIDALANGFEGGRIEVTGPKNNSLLILALKQNCLIQIDSRAELEQIIYLKSKLKIKRPISILVRIGGLITKDTRFGIGVNELTNAISIFRNNEGVLDFQGLSFHLDSNVTADKIFALEKLFEIQDKFRQAGLASRIINIGGGFKINYLDSEKDWKVFTGKLKKIHGNDQESITWRNNKLSGFYEYFTKNAGALYLDEILSAKLSKFDDNAGNMISEAMLTLLIEPGRALLDQTGITIARVNFVKKSPFGEILIGLDMNRSNLLSNDQEMMLDPIVLYKKRKKPGKRLGAYFVGNLCLENDFIYKHKTFLDQLPEIGDLVVFINTAAYNMDFAESQTIKQKIAKKITVVKRKNKFIWFEDEQYNPYLLEEKE